MFEEEKGEDEFGSEGEWDEEGYYGEGVPDIKKPFEIISLGEIEDKLKIVVQSCVDLFKISSDDAILILIHYKWNSEKLEIDWFTDQAKIRHESGVPAKRTLRAVAAECPVCFEKLAGKTPECLKCGHIFCLDCWKQDLENAVAKGPLSAVSECLWDGCSVKIPPSFFKNYLSPLSYSKFQKYLLESFVNNTKKLRWCPAPNCDYIIETFGATEMEVKCKCKFVFCFNCGNETHIPTTCDMFRKWNARIKLEGETDNWLASNTKSCPKCKVLTQKDTGCNHMTCSRCGHQYCWVCLEEWETHIKDYGCNKINKDLFKVDGSKNDTLRFMFYYTRYANHLQTIAQGQQLKEQLNTFVEVMTHFRGIELADTVFLTDSLNIIMEARKALKNSYIFAYYLKNAKDAQLLEFTQKDLEINCELSQELLERGKEEFIDSTDSKNAAFFSYKTELANITNVVLKFYRNFIKGITDQFAGLI